MEKREVSKDGKFDSENRKDFIGWEVEGYQEG